MANVKQDIQGLDHLIVKLTNLAKIEPGTADEALRVQAQDLRAILKSTPYPPKPPDSRYRRTGGLANAWSVVKKAVARYALFNSKDYSSYVVGVKQAFMHVGRWWQAHNIIRENMPSIFDRIKDIYIPLWSKK